jgi:hypothetical protein
MEYFVNTPGAQSSATCSDNECPCSPSVEFAPGQGYLYVSQEAADFRRDAHTLSDAQAKMERLANTSIAFLMMEPMTWTGLMICKQAAVLRHLDLSVASADAKEWWRTGCMPLRPSPRKQSIWQRLLGSSQQPPISDLELFSTRFGDHLQRIHALGGLYSSFTEQYLSHDVVSMLSAAASEKMALTRSDRKEHSMAVSNKPVSYWICTIPCSVPDAKTWFGEAYGGYSQLLDRALVSVRSAGCEVLVHIVFGRTKKDGWVNVTILPFGSKQFDFKPILPVDLLTENALTP